MPTAETRAWYGRATELAFLADRRSLRAEAPEEFVCRPTAKRGESTVKVRNIYDVPAKVMTKPDQEGLIVRNVINKDDAGAQRMILLSSEIPPARVHLLHRHPNAEQIMYVVEGSCVALSESEPVRLKEGDAVFISRGEWHGVRNDGERPAVTLVIYSGAGTLEEAGYEEHPQQFDRA
jgi:quercetin dioxygenase-like cupin family protein